jgi:hypothetical protein
MEKTMKQSSVLKGKITEIFINREDAVSVLNVNQFKRHRCSTFHGILVTARGTETAVVAKRNGLKISTVWVAVHSTTKIRITTVYHLFDIFYLRRFVMKSIFNFFIIVGKDSL